MVWRGGEREWIRRSLLHHPFSGDPQSPQALRVALFYAASPSKHEPCGVFSVRVKTPSRDAGFAPKTPPETAAGPEILYCRGHKSTGYR